MKYLAQPLCSEVFTLPQLRNLFISGRLATPTRGGYPHPRAKKPPGEPLEILEQSPSRLRFPQGTLA